MNSRVLLGLIAFTLGCSPTPTTPSIPSTPPVLRGVLAGPGDLGSRLVVANPAAPESCSEKDRAQVQFGAATIYWRSGTRAQQADLSDGRVVSVWTNMGMLSTCPPTIAASVVVIEP